MKKFYIIIIILSSIVTGIFLYNRFAFLHVIVKFDNLEPFEKQVPVYYKGFKVGKSTKIYPDANYNNTFLNLQISPSDVRLPKNITAKLQKSASRGFINLIPPETASVEKIKDGDIIKGDTVKDINSMLSDKLASGSLDSIIDNSSNLLDSANQTVQELGGIFTQINEILTDTRKDIKTATSSLAKTTVNLENISTNLNNALNKDTLKNSSQNIEETTKNIKEISENLNSVSRQIDEVSMPLINSAVCNTNSTMKNVNEITKGIKNTLQKRLGLAKIMFGKPIDKKCK